MLETNRRALALGAGALLVAAAAPSATAHDMWLVPPSGSLPVGEEVRIEVAVGMDFPTSTHAIDPERVTVRALGPDSARVDVELRRELATSPTSDDGDSPGSTRAELVPDRAGAWAVGATTRPNVLELEAQAFNDYLLHDGLAHVLVERLDAGELDRPAVERYSKHVKARFRVGDSSAGDVWSAALGLELEVLPLADPFAARPGSALPVEVRFRGAPLANANLCWDHPGNGEAFSGQTWTDDRGQALVPIARSGPMTLRLVHMTRPRHADYEWESFWSSTTFRVERSEPDDR